MKAYEFCADYQYDGRAQQGRAGFGGGDDEVLGLSEPYPPRVCDAWTTWIWRCLVGVDVIVEPCESTKRLEAWQARNRLAVAYESDVVVRDTRKTLSDFGVKQLFSFANGELDHLGFLRVGVGADPYEKPREMIECGTGIVEAIPNEQTPLGGELPDSPDNEPPMARLFVQLFPHREVWFRMFADIPVHCGFELATMDFCPAELGPGSGQGIVAHGEPTYAATEDGA